MDRAAALRDQRRRRDRLRLLVATAVVAFAIAWPAYAYGWQRSGGEPIRWRSERVVTNDAEPSFRVTRAAGAKRVSIALGARSSTGYGIEVLRAEEQRGRILVVLREQAPSLDRRGQARLTFPALVVVLPDVDKPVAVEWVS